ncbi:MAG: T9SS type A sorting domain-containing protein [Bacteroidetes bacterium]|nr:T9SS type A sorting domain-containing protein [Bacteroidota bacterium]
MKTSLPKLSICFRIILSGITLLLLICQEQIKAASSPVTFLQNGGQWDSTILFSGQSTATRVAFLREGLSFSQSGEEVELPDGTEDYPFIVWNMKFVEPSTSLNISGTEGKESVFSYLSGNDPKKWVIHPEEFSQLKYSSVFQGVDLDIYGHGTEIKYDYIVHPGADINSIKAYYEGITSLSLTPKGELAIGTPYNVQLQKKPVAWQIVEGKKQFVEMNYLLINDSTFGFESTQGYNDNYDLIIDPLFQMVWSSYTKATGAGNNINYCFSNAMDNDGNVYLTGMVDASFPTTAGAYSGPGNIYPEIFVSKFASDGTTMLYGTYLPGSSSEFGTGIAVDNLGRAYVTGVVDLNITGLTNFPSTPNAYQPIHDAGSDAFLTVLNSTGTGLIYSSFLGGTGSETGYGIALGGTGIAYITGNTSVGNFPRKNSSPFPSGDRDAFVAKFDINQSGANSLVYSVRLGGGPFSYSEGRSIAVNNAGNAFITGKIFSSSGTPTYPISAGAYNSVFNTGMDGVMTYVTKLSATTPVTLDYSTFLAPGTGSAIALHAASGDAYVVGSTNTFTFPVTPGALQTTHAGNNGTDAFVLRLNASGTALVYSTFLGGYRSDDGTGLAVNSIGEAYAVGISQDSFPTSTGAYQPRNAGTYDFFAVNLNASGTGYGCGGSTYIGGSDADYSGSFYDYPSPHLSLRDHGGNNDTVCISSTTHSQDFPTTPGVYGPVKVNGIADQPVFFKLTCFTSGVVPAVSMMSSDTSWCSKKAINFFDASTNNPTSWRWYFPGAVPDTSTAQNPTNIYYPNSGTFDVILVACNSFGCDSVSYPAFITEFANPAQPLVTINSDTLCAGVYSAYEWFALNNPTVILSTDQCFIVPAPGNYSVRVTDVNGCRAVSESAITEIPLLNSSISNLKVIPNPSSGIFTFEFDLLLANSVEIKILDRIGKEVIISSRTILENGNHQVSLDLSELSSGIYFGVVSSDTKVQMVKMVKN